MNRLVVICSLLVLTAGMAGAFAHKVASGDPTPGEFDAALAAELGADAYGMRRYVMVMLKSGDRRDQDAGAVAELQRGHMANMQRLSEEGHLVLAGPFIDGAERRGIFIFAVDTVEEARALTASDPAIQAGRLEAEYWPWYGSAALLRVGEIHERIAQESP